MENYIEEKRLYKIHMLGQFLAIGCAVRWKRKKRCVGKTLEIRN